MYVLVSGRRINLGHFLSSKFLMYFPNLKHNFVFYSDPKKPRDKQKSGKRVFNRFSTFCHHIHFCFECYHTFNKYTLIRLRKKNFNLQGRQVAHYISYILFSIPICSGLYSRLVLYLHECNFHYSPE